jgi:hypothetical protein
LEYLIHIEASKIYNMHWCILCIFEALMCILYIESTGTYYVCKRIGFHITMDTITSCNDYDKNNANDNNIIVGNGGVVFIRSIGAFITVIHANT